MGAAFAFWFPTPRERLFDSLRNEGRSDDEALFSNPVIRTSRIQGDNESGLPGHL